MELYDLLKQNNPSKVFSCEFDVWWLKTNISLITVLLCRSILCCRSDAENYNSGVKIVPLKIILAYFICWLLFFTLSEYT